MSYIDGFVATVYTANKQGFLDYARNVAQVFKEHGALQIVECWGDDVPEGKVTSFHMAVQRKPEETVVLFWITWPSKAARDEGTKKAMEDPRMKNTQMPFDGKRMIYGGFEVAFDTGETS
jgi:uncharacterized protein YbaA (DUF1428 family)